MIRRRRHTVVHLAVICLLVAAIPALAAEPLRSSIQPGEQITSIFEPFNVTGPFAGDRHCLVCENGANPVAMIFAREASDPLSRLLAKLDAATAAHREQELGAFAVFLTEDEALAPRLKEIAQKQSLKHVILATDPPAGPAGFQVAPEADVTVVLYRQFEVKANHAFRRGELNDAAIEKILADVPKIVGGS
jgi:hypothetical protein